MLQVLNLALSYWNMFCEYSINKLRHLESIDNKPYSLTAVQKNILGIIIALILFEILYFLAVGRLYLSEAAKLLVIYFSFSYFISFTRNKDSASWDKIITPEQTFLLLFILTHVYSYSLSSCVVPANQLLPIFMNDLNHVASH
jgi:hypothetical protein